VSIQKKIAGPIISAKTLKNDASVFNRIPAKTEKSTIQLDKKNVKHLKKMMIFMIFN